MNLRRLTALGFIALLLLGVGRQAVLRAWFSLANDSFTAVFCVNIEEPALMCHGQCQIDDLEADWQEERQSPMTAGERDLESKVFYPETDLFSSPEWRFNLHDDRPVTNLHDLSGRLYRPAVFHPPEMDVLT